MDVPPLRPRTVLVDAAPPEIRGPETPAPRPPVARDGTVARRGTPQGEPDP